MGGDKSEVLQGTLDMMILKTLHALGPLHGFGIARRIEQVSEDVLTLNEGTVYTSLLRLQQQGWINPSGEPQKTIAGRDFTRSPEKARSNLRLRRKTGIGSPE